MQNYFDSDSSPVFAADFDYFRIPRARWELILTRLKQMGVNTVTLTVPWGFHQFRPDTVDLIGTTLTRRNVVGVLNLCARFNLHVILNIGPYADNGVLGDGLPPWLLDDEASLEEKLPAAVQGWFKAVSQTLTKHQWPNGPVIAAKVNDKADEQQPVLDTKLTEVKWPIWLRKRYDGIDELNAAYDGAYHSVSDVDFPNSWAKASTPLEKDAQIFLEEMQVDSVGGYELLLREAGWKIPLYPFTADAPPIRAYDMPATLVSAMDVGKKRSKKRTVINLQRPVRVDRDPVDVSQGPVWAEMAPIRADSSVRAKFWDMRQALWYRSVAKAVYKDDVLCVSAKNDLVIAGSGNTPLKIETTVATGSSVYKLYMDGQLVPDANLKVGRGKLGGLYQIEDDTGQTDLVFLLEDLAAPLKTFPLNYLRDLLSAQVEVLNSCANQSEQLSQMLALTDSAEDETAPQKKSGLNSYTLSEARRGLREADAALRKAVSSIGGLEGGFDTMLDKDREIVPQQAINPITISPEVFEGDAQNILVDAGDICAQVAPQLKSAAAGLQNTVDASAFTVAQYQESYALAIDVTQSVREALLALVAQLRLNIASERLPLVVWRIHDQIQGITENLRWGVLRQ